MSAAKRKHGAGTKGQESAKKRQRTNSDSKDTVAPTAHISKSVLSKEQPAFPRGGAGPLSLIEQRQIRAKADRDASREAAADTEDLFGGKVNAVDESEESDLDLKDVDEKQTFAKKKSKKPNKKKASNHTDSIPIRSVSHRTLADGSLLLARITNISSRGLNVALPNNLSGFVPLTAVSKQFNSVIEKTLQQNSDDGASEPEEEDDADVRKLFRVGQLLRVAVQNISDDEGAKKENKKRIDLSIEPEKVNVGLQRAMLTPGVTVQASIVSVQDHGAVVDMGLADGTAAFLPKKALPKELNMSDLKVGAVLLCSVSDTGVKGKAVQLVPGLTPNTVAKKASSVDAYLPGTLVEVLLTDVTDEGLAGKVLGLLDVTADLLHSTSFLDKAAFSDKYQIGQKVKARLIANFPLADHKRMAFSLLDGLVDFDDEVEDRLPLSSIVDRAQVISVIHGLGIYLSLPSGAHGFAHISRLSDKAVDSLSETTGPYKVGTEHQARILEYNSIDGLYILSLEKSVIEQPFLRLEDVTPGEVVKGTIEKLLVGATGVRGLLVKLASGITGFVSSIHLSDATLSHPEKKYREGMTVKARVLSVDTDRRRLELTLKKSLINSDQPVWGNWKSIDVGASTVGTLVKVESTWAVVQFYGSVKGRLPVSEMSEAYIKDARQHFKTGQVLTVHALHVDPETQRLTLTARDPESVTRNDTSLITPGSLVAGTVFEKSADDVLLRLEPSGTVARLDLDHVADGSENKRRSALEKIRVGQKLEGVLVLEVKARAVVLSNKVSLRKAAEEGKLLKNFEGLVEEAVVTGFISNITEHRVFVRFAQGITGVINKAQIPDDQADLPDFGMKVLQPVSARVVYIDFKGATPRFWLSMRTTTAPEPSHRVATDESAVEKKLVDPVDERITSFADLGVGATIKVRITSIKETQLNVYIAKDIQGRVDVSEVYDKIEDVPDRKAPLRNFCKNQVIAVKVLGRHDSRSYRFLPLSHRTSKNTVFELSARPSILSEQETAVLKLQDIKVGESYMAFVNNIADHSLMVNISPAVRGRISDRDVSDDLAVAANLPRHFPIGSVLLAKVTSVDVDKQRLDLSAKSGAPAKTLTIDNVSAGDIVAGRVTKTTERSVIVQLSENLVGAAELIDIADDYDLADPVRFKKGEIVRAYVLQVDKPNKKIYLSFRPSKILSTGIEAKDPELSLQTISVGDIRRGFITNVSEKGVFVTLARGLTAFVRVTNLSDDYLKEWRDMFQKDQLVQGKIILVDKDSGHIQMSLKKSHIDGTYQPPITFGDLSVGDIVEGKIAKVEIFGVFIVVNNSANVRGLCHRSEIAEKRIQDVTKAGFSEGDKVKAKVLKIDPDQRRVNFGMKASYFGDETKGDEDSGASDEDVEDVAGDEEGELASDDGGALLQADGDSDDEQISDEDDEGASSDFEHSEGQRATKSSAVQALTVGGFDWFGAPASSKVNEKRSAEDSGDDTSSKPKKKKKRPETLVDRTGDLDTNGPQSTDDFERLLLSEPDNAALWIQYMAFHVNLGDIDAARSVATKALASIGLANESSKRAIWIALFNIENEFGDDESLQSTLERSCQTMDPEGMHTALASIYIQSGKNGKADELFQTILKKFTQNPKLWVNYATFLFDNLEEPARARALLPRALQALPPFTHFDVTRQFAQLEFKTKTGVPEEGRTRFQGLVNLYPKRIDLFNVMLDHEIKLGDAEQVRGVFEQVLSKNLKPAKVKPFFKRWLDFEKTQGDEKKAEEVQERAAKWVAQYQKNKEA